MSSIPEFVVDIEPGSGSTLRLRIQASGLAPISDEIERALPSFPPADLDQLRSGEASARIAEAIADQVTRWLLETDLRGHLGTAFNAAAVPFRIVIRPHIKVLPDLAEVPFELLKFNADPLVLSRNVRALVHMRQFPRRAPPARLGSSWPLRVLLVRSNPADLGGQVPPILPLRDRILAIAKTCSLGDAVAVTTLSSEPGGSGPVTYDSLRSKLRDEGGYSVLVYLGHGDVQDAGFEGLPPMGVLLFELEGSPYASPVYAEQLRNELQNYPVPVVLLAGCLTAESAAASRRLPRSMRGSQSVAEALVYEDSGVQCAVGTRYRLETEDANAFLSGFFESLIMRAPGDVEQAVRQGREDLFAHKLYPPSWSAPVIFRAAGEEPTFEWMRRAPVLFDPLDERDQEFRREVWKVLTHAPRDAPDDVLRFPMQILAQVEASFLARWTQRGSAVVWPAQVHVEAASTARVSIQQDGALTARCLKGRMTFPTELPAHGVRSSRALEAAGFRVFYALDLPGEVSFQIHAQKGVATAIPPGTLLYIDLELSREAPSAGTLSIDSLESDPPSVLLRGWSNAILLPR